MTNQFRRTRHVSGMADMRSPQFICYCQPSANYGSHRCQLKLYKDHLEFWSLTQSQLNQQRHHSSIWWASVEISPSLCCENFWESSFGSPGGETLPTQVPNSQDWQQLHVRCGNSACGSVLGLLILSHQTTQRWDSCHEFETGRCTTATHGQTTPFNCCDFSSLVT